MPSALPTQPLLQVDDLRVRYRTARGPLQAVDGVSFTLDAGETLGLVGESGCGKSSLGKAVMRLVDAESGSIRLGDTDITHLSPGALRPLRSRFQMVFQDPAASLDPRHRVSRLIEEPLIVQGSGDRAQRTARVRELMQQVGLRADMADRLPHEFSGGQRQRIAIARALALGPDLMVCDEPVSALDVSLQAQILNLLADLQQANGIGYLFISHDLSVVQHLADRIAVMYLGQFVELAPRSQLWRRPAHPYTRALIGAVPVMDPDADRHVADLQGDVPSPFSPPTGCRFHTRCPQAFEPCRDTAPALREIAPGHLAACHLHGLHAAPVSAPIQLHGIHLPNSHEHRDPHPTAA